MNECKHWACNLKNNTCIGCITVICPLCKNHLFVNVKIKIIAIRYPITEFLKITNLSVSTVN